MRRFFVNFALLLAFSTFSFAQDTSSPTTTNARPRMTTTQATKPKPAPTKPPVTQPSPKQTPTKPAGTPAPAADTVLAAFNKIIEGIRKANVDLATGGYWNSPALVLFNYNGSVTKGWE